MSDKQEGSSCPDAYSCQELLSLALASQLHKAQAGMYSLIH